MNELEKKVLDTLTQAMPKLTEAEQNRLLGYGQGVILNPYLNKEMEAENAGNTDKRHESIA